MFFRLDLPELFEADAVALRLAALAQVERLVELLGKMTVTAFAEDRALRVQLHSALERVLRNDRLKLNARKILHEQTLGEPSL